jgi:hypothetical protein
LAAGFYFFPMPDRSGIGLWIETPPSTPSTWPVTCFDIDEAKKTTALAMSSGLPRRRGGIAAFMPAMCSADSAEVAHA